MSLFLLLAVISNIMDNPINQAAQVTADHALDVAYVGLWGVLVTVLGGITIALIGKGRLDRSGTRAQSAQAQLNELDRMYINLARDFGEFKAKTEAHNQEQDALIADLKDEVTSWRAWGNRVLAVIKARPDGEGIEGQFPPMPAPRVKRR